MTATLADAGAAYEVKLNGVVDQDGIVPLAVGDGNVIAVVVTAQDGEATTTYTVTVTRAGSGDASLSALSLSGVTLSPVFASGTTAYTTSVVHAVTETTVTATAVEGAAYEVKLNGVVDQDGIVPLAVGDGNVIAVVVTAQDGKTTQSYSVTVTRAGSGDLGLSALSLSGVTLMPAFAWAQRCHVLSNARCLTEGIDVPALDAILFLQPRKSQIDVVQAVGRVMRKAQGKRYGYIILPVVVPSGADPERALDRNDAYSHVWQVLQALRAHDERFDAYINKLDLNRSADGPISVIGVGTEGDDGDGEDVRSEADARVTQELLDFDLGQLRTAIIAQIVKRCGERRYWEKWADSVTDIARRHDERIRALIDSPDGNVGQRFAEFVAALRGNLNDSITRDNAAAMLSQHLITRPVFDALFGGQEFTERNPVSLVMQRMVVELEGYGLEAEDG